MVVSVTSVIRNHPLGPCLGRASLSSLAELPPLNFRNKMYDFKCIYQRLLCHLTVNEN